MLDVLIDALLDTAKMVPFLFGAYLLMEVLEHKVSDKMKRRLMHLGPFGPIGGALLGVVPQCGFSVTAANFYSGKIITIGTVIAVFLSTSDEAIPILISHPESFGYLWKMILIKVLVAIVTGISVDLIYRLVVRKRDDTPHFEEICEHCDCEHHSVFYSAARHTIGTGIFILVINLVMGYAIYWIGEETIGTLLLNNTIFQPFVAALIGLIPNCASSVILTELFTEGVVSFGSVMAGLCAGAGLGLAVLFRSNKHHMKQNFLILGILYGVAVVVGLLTDWIIP
ncbi:MAG: putative manganese transporter [Oscillospiraceae bacterium]|nr:putative manganese transporter [Oscillospiraceae bacterium]